jgi:Cu(I)/Ag(I) efflux system membrane fusion protein
MSVRKASVVAASCIAIAAVAGGLWLVTQRGAAPAASAGAHAEAPAKAAQWICPMHPTIVSDRPGACPICGMDLVPADDAGGETEPAGVAGLASVHVGEGKLRRIGASTATVARAEFFREVRAVATVAVDETRLRQIHTKTAGFIERLHANAVGETVRAGQPLLEIYSPELLAAQQEFLVAQQARDRLAGSALPDVASWGGDLVASARRRLELLDMTPAAIDDLARTGEARRTVTLRAPLSGTILKREIAQGSQVDPQTVLFELADLTRVWAIASVYENELAYVREGQDAALTLAYLPGVEFHGKVARVYPVLDATTRTAQVRVEFGNADGALKPDMFGEVRIVADLGERLSVPVAAVMETGARALAFVDQGDGVFEPREVTLGLRIPDRVEILSGLAEGERVLASGNFFVDAESRMRAALDEAHRNAAATAAAATPAAPAEHRH